MLPNFVLLQAGGAPPGCGGGMSTIGMLVIMFAIFYFMLIRPQQKKAKQHQEMLKNLKKGDEVVTTGGIIGRISGITDQFVTLEIQEKVRVKLLRSHVTGKTGTPAAEAAPESK
jgi:preprotein translocase subunit YajC